LVLGPSGAPGDTVAFLPSAASAQHLLVSTATPNEPTGPIQPPCPALHALYRQLLWPGLTSATPSRPLAVPLAPRQGGRPPGVRRVTFAPLRRIYVPPFRVTSGWENLASSPATARLLCGSCSSNRSFACSFLQTPPRSG